MGTPGRLEDLISTGKLTLHQVRFFVLDEAVSQRPVIDSLNHKCCLLRSMKTPMIVYAITDIKKEDMVIVPIAETDYCQFRYICYVLIFVKFIIG